MSLEKIEELEKYSEQILEKIRTELEQIMDVKDFCIVATGSYGRKEASSVSDLDLFIVVDDITAKNKVNTKAIQTVIDKYIQKDTGSTGIFGADILVAKDELISNFGGEEDTNQNLTRRMLLLLEGTYLYNKEYFDKIRLEVVKMYIKEYTSGNHIATFFLNDIIRYYRTIVTDFEYKTIEREKEWGVRNIKLRYSRKLLYFSGLLLVGETYTASDRENQIEQILALMELSPIKRIQKKCNTQGEDLLKLYSEFLDVISEKENRDELDKATPEKAESQPNIFVEMQEKSREFSSKLYELFNVTYSKEHPIHQKLVF